MSPLPYYPNAALEMLTVTDTTSTSQAILTQNAVHAELAATTSAFDLVSSDNADNGATATGVLTVDVYFIDTNGRMNTTAVTVNGTTKVDVTLTNAVDILFMKATSIGSGLVAAGNIQLTEDAGTSSVYAEIVAGEVFQKVARLRPPKQSSLFLAYWYAESDTAIATATTLITLEKKILLADGTAYWTEMDRATIASDQLMQPRRYVVHAAQNEQLRFRADASAGTPAITLNYGVKRVPRLV